MVVRLPIMSLNPYVLPKALPRTPELVPVAFLNLKVKNATPILQNNTYSHAVNYVEIDTGAVTTVPNKLNLELDIVDITGIDHITANTAAGVNVLDCNLYGKTANGLGVFIKYPGRVKATDKVNQLLTGQASHSEFEDEYVTNNPVFTLAEGIEDKYKWTVRENILGKGRFVRDNEDKLYVQYYLYVLN